MLEKHVNNQLTGFLDVYSILSGMQFVFCSGYGCVTATLKVLNDVTIALDSNPRCDAVFIDLAKGFDTVHHSIVVGRLSSIGVSEGSLSWFANYLSQRVWCIKSEHLLSQPLPVTKGVPLGSILDPTLFSIYINNIAQAVGSAPIHLYAVDTVLYSAGPSPDFVLNALHQSFLSVQQAFSALNFVLNTSKTKVMWFGKKNAPLPTGVITTSEGLELEVVNSSLYLGVWRDGTLSFSQQISKLQAKVKSRLGFLYRNPSSFPTAVKLTLIQMTILPMLDYGDVIYRSIGS